MILTKTQTWPTNMVYPPQWNLKTRHPADPNIWINWDTCSFYEVSSGYIHVRYPLRWERESCRYQFRNKKIAYLLLGKLGNGLNCLVCGHRACVVSVSRSLLHPHYDAILHHFGDV
jgi:hypothetical protein